MPAFEFAIAVCDEPEAHRKKEGDIIAVKSTPWNWGTKELDQYLIITLDGLTKEEAHKLCVPHFITGEDWYPSDDLPQPKIIAKRRFKIPLSIIQAGWLPSMDLERARDKTDTYQPLKETKIVLDTLESVAICFDKYKNSFRYATQKVAL